MSRTERKATAGLASIYAMRMLGLFMILPIFSVFAQKLEYTTPLLIGLAISAYGLTQAILQIPFGIASDHFGRKRVIAFGLCLFMAGSVLAAVSESIYGVIAGRALQGSGAIASAIMALLADLTREDHRTKAMATIGMSIGLAFAVSLVAGPIIAKHIGLAGIFWLTAGLAGIALLALLLIIPNPVRQSFHRESLPIPAKIADILKKPELMRLNIGIFALHLILTAGFVVLPLQMQAAGLAVTEHWQIYLPTLLLSIGVMIPMVILAESKGKMKLVFCSAIALVCIAEAGFASNSDNLMAIALFMFVFFAGFNVLEATLPSLISKIAPADSKGTAMGVYSTSQFFGAFCGGTMGGWLYGEYGTSTVFIATCVVALLWLTIASTMQRPKQVSSLLWSVSIASKQIAQQLSQDVAALPGIIEAIIVPEDNVAYLKIDKKLLDMQALEQLLGAQGKA